METLIEVKDKLYFNIKNTGWNKFLKDYIYSDKFTKILEILINEYNNSINHTPNIHNVFNAFKYCPIDKLKLVILGQDPYPGFGIADGIAFSCSNTKKEQPSLKYIFNAIEESFHIVNYVRDPDLKRWSKQGILLLNTALTTRVGKPGSHYEMWENFIIELLQYLQDKNNVVYLLMGSRAKLFSKYILNKDTVFTTYHPAHAAYNGGKWKHNNIFSKIDKKLNSFIKW